MTDLPPDEVEDYVPNSQDDPKWWNREFEVERTVQEAERRHFQDNETPDELDGVLRWPGQGGGS